MQTSEEPADFTKLDDSTLLSRRAEMRAQLERLPPQSPDYARLARLYDTSTAEIDKRARAAWTRGRKEEKWTTRPGPGCWPLRSCSPNQKRSATTRWRRTSISCVTNCEQASVRDPAA